MPRGEHQGSAAASHIDVADPTESDGRRQIAADEDLLPPPNEVVAEVEDQLRRALADLDNLRKRFDREVARERAAERARVVALWLPVVDDLERALGHAGADTGAVVEGIRAVHQHALSVLERLGIHRFDDVGQPFDPYRHEAVGSIPSDAPAGTIVAAVRPGYRTGESTLRPASVVVSQGSG
jgi:molecular chaperone GrpE